MYKKYHYYPSVFIIFWVSIIIIPHNYPLSLVRSYLRRTCRVQTGNAPNTERPTAAAAASTPREPNKCCDNLRYMADVSREIHGLKEGFFFTTRQQGEHVVWTWTQVNRETNDVFCKDLVLPKFVLFCRKLVENYINPASSIRDLRPPRNVRDSTKWNLSRRCPPYLSIVSVHSAPFSQFWIFLYQPFFFPMLSFSSFQIFRNSPGISFTINC